jgi:MULE transposase domain
LQAFQQISIDGVVEQFLMYDSGNDLLPGRMLIFATRTGLQLLSRSSEWFSDGTFSTAPVFFEQLYTIHVVQYNAVLPVVYALLPNKSRATYVKMLQQLKNLQPGLQPQFLMTDFEQAALQAFELEFAGIAKTGCFFHLSQCVWRKVQSEGLKVRTVQLSLFRVAKSFSSRNVIKTTMNFHVGFE